jgi:hypothetical protein
MQRFDKKLITSMGLLPSRYSNFLDANIKDRAIVYGIKGGCPGGYCEIRLQTLADNLEGEFGNFAHFRYKQNKNKALKNAISKHPELGTAFNQLCYAFVLNSQRILE